jgi:hypothetical protein
LFLSYWRFIKIINKIKNNYISITFGEELLLPLIMPACTDTEYVNRTYYRHLKSKVKRDSPDEHQLDLSSAVITVNRGKSRNPLHRHAGYTMDLSGQDIAHVMPLPPFSKVST